MCMGIAEVERVVALQTERCQGERTDALRDCGEIHPLQAQLAERGTPIDLYALFLSSWLHAERGCTRKRASTPPHSRRRS